MVVVDSSALIPLAWVGRLDLISACFDDVRTTDDVRSEVVVEGKPGSSALEAFLEDASVEEPAPEAPEIARLEGIAVADASVVLLAADADEILLANDRALIATGESRGVECWWVTTLLLKCTADGAISGDEATEVLYDLVDEGMNLHPRVYAQVQRRLRELGSS